MIYQLVVPGPIEDVEETRVLEWHGEEGQEFKTGQLLVELETHKAVVEVRLTHAAVLRRILCQPGDWQQVGKPLGLLSDAPTEELPAQEGTDLPRLLVEFELT
jgi:pyruvate/2-oxoglutarate dehydrogenase complex dihydrolipoamide acyltransferase (E2) component